MTHNEPLLALNPYEAQIAQAIWERLFPPDDLPGAAEIGVLHYVDRALAGAYAEHIETYRLGLAALDRAARARYDAPFVACGPEQQDALLQDLERGTIDGMLLPPQGAFFVLLRAHLQEGLFADPAYGGNRDKLGWRTLGHPGVYLHNSAEENLTPEPVTKHGVTQSLADLGLALEGASPPPELEGYNGQRGALPPAGFCDVVLVGLGGMGGLVAPLLCQAGLKVVALEAGPWRTKHDFVPDELGAAYYCRANMGPKFASETPRWRRNDGEATQEATFSLGRMMNSVGGSVIHYGAWLRRFHPHHFRSRSRVRERWGEKVLPSGCALADWPVAYHDLEPYYARVERIVGVAGEQQHPDVWRSTPYPIRRSDPFVWANASSRPRTRWACAPTWSPLA